MTMLLMMTTRVKKWILYRIELEFMVITYSSYSIHPHTHTEESKKSFNASRQEQKLLLVLTAAVNANWKQINI